MAPRAQLQSILEGILTNVYFQPPPNVQMEYPAILYERDRANSVFSDNISYRITQRYQITLISRSPDQPEYQQIIELPMCSHDRFYVADNLNHDVFTIYF